MDTESVAIRSFAAELGERFCDIKSAGLNPDQFTELSGVYITEELPKVVWKAASKALERAAIAPHEVDLLLYVTAIPESQLVRPNTAQLLDRFSYTGSRLQHELGLTGARTIGIDQQGCSGLFAALDLAQAKLSVDRSIRNVLCVGGDALPAKTSRAVFHNAISDAGVALVVARGRSRFRIVGVEQLAKPYFWDPVATEPQLLATYFPSAKTVVERLLVRLEMNTGDIEAVIPTGIRRSSWPILLQLWGVSPDRCLHPSIPFGHTIQADPVLALQAAEESGALRPGMRLLLFTFGFGAIWSAAVLEVSE